MTELSPIDPLDPTGAATAEEHPSGGRRTRYRMLAIGGLAAAIIAGGGAVAVAASQSPTPPAAGSHPSGYGPEGARPSGEGPGGYGPGGFGHGPGPQSGSAPTTPPKARTPHLEGTVVSSSASTIVITDMDGFQRTIKISSSTKFSDGLTATIAKSTVIHAEGTVDADKTSLDATSIGKLTAGDHGPLRGNPAPPAA